MVPEVSSSTSFPSTSCSAYSSISNTYKYNIWHLSRSSRLLPFCVTENRGYESTAAPLLVHTFQSKSNSTRISSTILASTCREAQDRKVVVSEVSLSTSSSPPFHCACPSTSKHYRFLSLLSKLLHTFCFQTHIRGVTKPPPPTPCGSSSLGLTPSLPPRLLWEGIVLWRNLSQ